jgi:hypothetical protein
MWCLNREPIIYEKLQTGTNNPKISAKMRYAQLVNSAKAQTVFANLQPRAVIPLTNT